MILSKQYFVRFGLLLPFWLAGCGQKLIYPVHGRIVDPQGNPVTGLKGGAVEFEALEGKSSANGSIEADGSFTLTTKTPADGAHVGKNRVLIQRPFISPERPVPPVIEPKYEKFETSGLVIQVEPKNNEVELKVDLAPGRK